MKTNTPQSPLISIIIAVFNGGKSLSRAIESVTNQTYSNIELIIIDGGSTDNTVEVIKKCNDKIAYWVSEKDEGIYDAWNKGIENSKGLWIGFIGADDSYYPEAIENYVNLIQELNNPHILYISSKVTLINSKGDIIKTLGNPWEWNKFKKNMNVAHVGSLHSRKLFQIYGNYDTSYKIVGDYEMLLRAGKNLQSAYLPIVTVRMSDGGISASIKAIKEGMRAKKNTAKRNLFEVYLRGYIGIVKFWILKKIDNNYRK